MKSKRASICGNLGEQIDRLKKSVGRRGFDQAKKIVDTYDANVVKLAFKLLPKSQGAGKGLGKRIEDILKNVPGNKRGEMRELLLKAKRQKGA